jgi:hypothetical protein
MISLAVRPIRHETKFLIWPINKVNLDGRNAGITNSIVIKRLNYSCAGDVVARRELGSANSSQEENAAALAAIKNPLDSEPRRT